MDKHMLWATTIVDRKAELNKHQQVEDRMRRTFSGLKNKIEDLGGAENIAQLCSRKKTKYKAPKIFTNTHLGPPDCANFLRAATNGNLNMVDKFLEDGGDPNTADEFRKSALHRAAFEGHVSIVEKLLDNGANINFQDRLACTAVHCACRGGCLAVLKLLQNRGADINIKDKVKDLYKTTLFAQKLVDAGPALYIPYGCDGQLLSTPLHVATRTGHWEVVGHLVSSGVQINARDREGDTALHDAVRLNRYKIVKLLLLAGADMKIKNAEGVTATEQVKTWQCDTKEMLEKVEQMK